MICGGIDAGGTKIEARLFHGPDASPGISERWATPQADYRGFLTQVEVAFRWLLDAAADADIPVGLALAGPIDPQSGESSATNLPSTGHRVGADISDLAGRSIPLMNDCVAFTLSEAKGGAGDGARSVVGLTLGTGLGAGHCIDGVPSPRLSGLPVEIGHVGLSAALAARHDLPLRHCRCGRTGCFEAYLSGAGVTALAQHYLGRRIEPADLTTDTSAADVLRVWFDVLAEALWVLYVTQAPDVIVLGGGLSKMPRFLSEARAAFAGHALGTLPLPALEFARFGDGSAARGAALMGRAYFDA